MVAAICVGIIAASFLPQIDGKGDVDVRAWSAVGLISLPWLGLAGWPLLATRLKGLGPVHDLRLQLTWKQLGLGVLAGIVGLIGAVFVAAAQENITGHSISARATDAFDSVDKANWLPLFTFALLAGIGAPIVEEIAFRGMLFGALEKRGLHVVWCVTISAVLFVLFHAEPSRILLLLPIALALSTVRAYTGSTGASIVAHMTVNLLPAIQLAHQAFH